MLFPSVFNVETPKSDNTKVFGIIMLGGFLQLKATGGNLELMQAFLVFCAFQLSKETNDQ